MRKLRDSYISEIEGTITNLVDEIEITVNNIIQKAKQSNYSKEEVIEMLEELASDLY